MAWTTTSPSLLEKILSYKDRSPLVTIFDDCSQSARPLLKEFVRRANQGQRKVVYVAFEDTAGASRVKKSADTFVISGLKTIEERTASSSHGLKLGLRSMSLVLKDIQQSMLSNPQTSIVIIDCITPVFLEPAMDPIHFLGSILSLQPYTVILSHHTDILLPLRFPQYPSAQPLLSHISTTVLRLSSFGHHTLKVEADSKALPNPIEQDRARDGVISTLASNCSQQIIIGLEYRKRSGRTISERHTVNLTSGKAEPLDRKPEQDSRDTRGLDFGTTFNLGMTQRQKESKEDVVLPHFSARGIFSGSDVSERSGDIEYTLEAEDDFDDEEDVDEDLLI